MSEIMVIEKIISKALQETIWELYSAEIEIDTSQIQKTRKEFEGDFTIVVFPFVKMAKKTPDVVAREIGIYLMEKLKNNEVISFNTIKGYLNISLSDQYWLRFFQEERQNASFGIRKEQDEGITIIEFSSPNTNKPLHLGHIRNNLLGASISSILENCGKKVVRVNLVNDRGIHICKSMLAWLKFGEGETPESSGMKGDHFVGKYYVAFDQHYKEEIKNLIMQGVSEEEAAKKAPLILEAQEMLRKWEEGDNEIRQLWQMMNEWVYSGFEKSYDQLGIFFDKTYYESETYILGKGLVEEGVKKGIFEKREDGSVWVDLSAKGMDEKLLLRSNGTSVYITQDMGTAQQRYEEYHPKSMIYVVGNEQVYHFNVLKTILSDKLQFPCGNMIYHLSYGMVELPHGKMKSREGTVVDADDLMKEMFLQAKESTENLGKIDFTSHEAEKLYEMIGLGALKYFILKVDPQKNMLFNPEESIDFNGNTAPFIQYTHARICSLIRKAIENKIDINDSLPEYFTPSSFEKELIKKLYDYPQIVINAGKEYSPALIANYIYDLAKEFNRFYQETPIFKEEDSEKRLFRLQLSSFTANIIKKGMGILGIQVPEKM